MCAGKAGFERSSKRFFDLNETIPQKKSFNNQKLFPPIKDFTIVTKITTLPAPDTIKKRCKNMMEINEIEKIRGPLGYILRAQIRAGYLKIEEKEKKR